MVIIISYYATGNFKRGKVQQKTKRTLSLNWTKKVTDYSNI